MGYDIKIAGAYEFTSVHLTSNQQRRGDIQILQSVGDTYQPNPVDDSPHVSQATLDIKSTKEGGHSNPTVCGRYLPAQPC
jgi:hypothetical protein